MSIKVFKFGGASVKNAEGIRNVFDIIRSFEDNKILIVVSAMGKMTNALENVFKKYFSSPGSESLQVLMDDIIDQHLEYAKQLELDVVTIEKSLRQLVEKSATILEKFSSQNKSFVYDQIVSLGELFSSTLLSNFIIERDLKATLLDAREVLKTNDTFQEAKVDFQLTSDLIRKEVDFKFTTNQYIVTQGFIGSTEDNRTTTLGREGSDYTASIFAYCIDAKELTIWKDVPGILTADPRRFDNVEKLNRLSYSEAIEMTYYGAKVIHPKTIRPIQNKNIKLYVKSFLDPEGEGTIITSDGLPNYPPIVVIQDDMMLMQVFTKDFTFIAEDHLSEIFAKLKEHRIKLSVMRNSAISFTICIQNPGEEKLKNFTNDLGDNFSFDMYKDLQLITIRYYQEQLIKSLTKNKIVLFEESMKHTIQLVVKSSLELIEKTPS